MNDRPDVYVSSDGGYNWKKVIIQIGIVSY